MFRQNWRYWYLGRVTLRHRCQDARYGPHCRQGGVVVHNPDPPLCYRVYSAAEWQRRWQANYADFK